MALGELELTPWVFWRLTPREFRVMLAGMYRREDRLWHKVGTLGLWIVGPHSKKKHTILGLLGRAALKLWPKNDTPEPAEPDPITLEEMREAAVAKALAWAKDD